MSVLRLATILLLALALPGCSRLDTLAVIESRDGLHEIQWVLDTRSGDHLICVTEVSTRRCNASNAQVVVSPVDGSVELDVDWTPDKFDSVTVSVKTGRLERAERTAVQGRVSLEYIDPSGVVTS